MEYFVVPKSSDMAAISEVRTTLASFGIDAGFPVAYKGLRYDLPELNSEQIKEINALDSVKFFGLEKDVAPKLLSRRNSLECLPSQPLPKEKLTKQEISNERDRLPADFLKGIKPFY